MCRKIIFIFTLFLVVVGVENVSFSLDNNALYGRMVVNDAVRRSADEYDVEDEDNEDQEDDDYDTDESDAKSTRSGNRRKVTEKAIQKRGKLFNMFDVSFSIGLGGLMLQNKGENISGLSKKFGAMAFLGFRVFRNALNGKMNIFFAPELVYEYHTLSFDTSKTMLYFKNKYDDKGALVALNSQESNKTFGGNVLSGDLLSLTKYDAENVKISKTKDAYLEELYKSVQELPVKNDALTKEIGEKDGKNVSASEKEGSFYDRLRYIEKTNTENKNIDSLYFAISNRDNGITEIPVLDENGKAVLDENGKEKTEPIKDPTDAEKAKFNETDIGKKYDDFKQKKKIFTDYSTTQQKLGNVTKTIKEWYQNSSVDINSLTATDKATLITIMYEFNKKETDLEVAEKALKDLVDKLKSDIESLDKAKADIEESIKNNEEEIKTNNETLAKNKDTIVQVSQMQDYTDYTYKDYYFSSSIINMLSYSTKIGFEIDRISPYLKVLFGALVTNNTVTINNVVYKELLMDAEKSEYKLYYTNNEQVSETKKKTSLMYGVGFGVSFKLTDNFGFFAEYIYRTSKYSIEFQDNIEKTFVYNLHSLLAGVNILF